MDSSGETGLKTGRSEMSFKLKNCSEHSVAGNAMLRWPAWTQGARKKCLPRREAESEGLKGLQELLILKRRPFCRILSRVIHQSQRQSLPAMLCLR